ncbi:MAG TPA: molybdopterin molybdotransferase MoeA [Pseudosphingobacterium sp.]|nr:molybdopterin molybdotransferase MoeA [Pseudosphingobacterium sp.]
MISYNAALQIIMSNTKMPEKQQLSLLDSLGYTLAQEIVADRPYPPFNRAAMDGIAIRYTDYQNGIKEFKLQETIYAGQEPVMPLNTGYCYKIMTGAAVPLSADTIVRQEDLVLSSHESYSLTNIEPKAYANIAKKGQDVLKGASIIPSNTTITPSIISLLASLGIHSPWVIKKPNIALFTTGDEIIDLYQTPKEVEIRNSNRYLLTSLLLKDLIKPTIIAHIKDQVEDLQHHICRASEYDIILINGGVSGGDRDLVLQVLEKLGARTLFHRVAIKPGKPIWCGVLPSGCIVFGLPGNPFSCLTTYNLFVRPLLRKISMQSFVIPMTSPRIKSSKLDEFFPVRLTADLQLEPLYLNGSGDIRLGLQADGLALHPATMGNVMQYDKLPFFAF